MTIGVDIDGVLFPWDDVARDVLVERFGIERPAPSTYWSFLKDNIHADLWRWLWTAEGQSAIFGRTWETYAGAVAMVNALTCNPACAVHFVTHRDPRRAGLFTALFLREHFSKHPWAGIHVVQNGTPKRSLGRFDVFIDDKPETVFDFMVMTMAQVFSPVRPWNVDELWGMGSERFVHYTNPAEIVEWVDARV